jgi:hypothetical protein
MWKYTVLTIIAVSCLLLFIVVQSEYVSAQQPGNLTKMIEDKYARIYKSSVFVGPYGTNIPYQLVTVKYESPTTILISGKLIAPYVNTSNSGIWEAMDMLKGQYGFKFQQVMTSAVDSKGNPTDVDILMIK